MTKPQIKSINDYKAERRRLKAAIAEKELLVKNDFASIQQSLKPINVATNWLSKFLVTKDKNLVNEGVDSLLTFVLRNVVLARAGWITKLVVPYLAKNYTNNKITENKAEILDYVRDWLHKFQAKRRQRTNGQFDKSTADIDI